MTTAADRARIRREALEEAAAALDRARSVMADDDIEQYGVQYGINVVRELFDGEPPATPDPRDAEMAVLQARNAQLWALLSGQQHVVEEIDRLNSEIAHLKAGVRAVLDGDYRSTPKTESCQHGIWGYDCCENCIDEHLQAVLDSKPGETK